MHGKNDTAVPNPSARKFATGADQLSGNSGVACIERDGEYGFDGDLGINEEGLAAEVDDSGRFFTPAMIFWTFCAVTTFLWER